MLSSCKRKRRSSRETADKVCDRGRWNRKEREGFRRKKLKGGKSNLTVEEISDTDSFTKERQVRTPLWPVSTVGVGVVDPISGCWVDKEKSHMNFKNVEWKYKLASLLLVVQSRNLDVTTKFQEKRFLEEFNLRF